MSEWIKCSERMPELRKGDNDFSLVVLMRRYTGQVFSGSHSAIDECWYSEEGEWIGDDRDVLHWMPLPAPLED